MASSCWKSLQLWLACFWYLNSFEIWKFREFSQNGSISGGSMFGEPLYFEQTVDGEAGMSDAEFHQLFYEGNHFWKFWIFFFWRIETLIIKNPYFIIYQNCCFNRQLCLADYAQSSVPRELNILEKAFIWRLVIIFSIFRKILNWIEWLSIRFFIHFEMNVSRSFTYKKLLYKSSSCLDLDLDNQILIVQYDTVSYT